MIRRAGLWLWPLVVLVAGLEIYAASLVLRPNVDPDYRAYFIDRSSDCWPHITPADYTLGETLSFVDGAPHQFFPNKICGWFYPDAQGTWSYGPYSLLRFRFEPTGTPLQLTLTAAAMVTPEFPVQRVEISAGDTVLTTLSFDSTGPQTRTVDVPTDLAASGADGLTLRFDYPDARPGDELGPNEDSHLRAIRMVSLKLDQAG